MFNKIQLATNSDGLVESPNVHDAEIIAIKLNDNEKGQDLFIDIKTENGRKFILALRDVKHLHSQNFGTQNVINDIYCITNKNVSSRQKDFLMWFPYLSTAEKMQNLLNEIESGASLFVEINPSVGCEINCICKSVDFTKTTET